MSRRGAIITGLHRGRCVGFAYRPCWCMRCCLNAPLVSVWRACRWSFVCSAGRLAAIGAPLGLAARRTDARSSAQAVEAHNWRQAWVVAPKRTVGSEFCLALRGHLEVACPPPPLGLPHIIGGDRRSLYGGPWLPLPASVISFVCGSHQGLAQLGSACTCARACS